MSITVTEDPTTRPATPSPTPADAPAKRRFYYGWVMLPLAIMALIASSPGQTFGISIFNEPMRIGLGLSHSQIAAAYMLGTLLGAIPIAWIGAQMDRHGLRRTMLSVVTMFSVACVMTSFVQGWMTLVVVFCMLRMLGPGALAFLSGNTLSFWFEKRLGMVEGIRQLGIAAAIAIVPILNVWLLNSFGWRTSYILLGTGTWLLLFPTFLLLLKNRPEDVGQSLDNHTDPETITTAADQLRWGFTVSEVLRMPAFWIVTAGTGAFSLIHTAVFFSFVPIFEERGLTQEHAAAAMTMFAACLATMQLTSGTLSDRLPPRMLLTTGLLGLGLAMTVLNFASSPATALLAGAAMGTSQGVYFGAAHPLWARYFGRLHLGKIRGTLMTINVASSSLGPVVAGVTRDLTGEFGIALTIFAIAPLPFAVLSWFVTAPQRKTAVVPAGPVLAVEG
ncbi:MFS transporter [Maioricimonas rarisocia]|nr:MFS transporter [Maioricimonas rarisocia]